MSFYIHMMMEADAANVKADHEAQHGRALVNNDSVSDLDPYVEYKRHYDAFVAAEGKVPSKAKREFFRLRREIEERVLKQTDVISLTTNKLGSRDFEDANYIFIDEGGQTLVASLAVALTQFTKFKAVLLIADQLQLPPTVLAKVMYYSQISPMESCASYGLFMPTLTVQYRIAEEIALWPSQFYYEGVLRNHSTTNVDNAWRQAVRAIFLED
ncbi:MAG: hypothetical protein Q9192_008726 [Flavoplaca navasiana]